MDSVVDVTANCRAVLENIRVAADKSGRDPGSVRLMAATKTQGIAQVRAVVEAGVRLLGENYVQEAQPKRAALGDIAEWHLIGHLQRNKARSAVEIFSVIESLDNLPLARILDREGCKRERDVRVFVEVNLAEEASKTGVRRPDLVPLLREVAKLTRVKVEGLMSIPPAANDLEVSRPYFRELRELRDTINDLSLDNVSVTELSMGMTQDYMVAIEEGATIVRVGTALFGPRPSSR
jgi:pyridoxal phosphate enzyme (YggS family)